MKTHLINSLLIGAIILVLGGSGYFMYTLISHPTSSTDKKTDTLSSKTVDTKEKDQSTNTTSQGATVFSIETIGNASSNSNVNAAAGITAGFSDPNALLAAATTPMPPVANSVYNVTLHSPIYTSSDIKPNGTDALTPAGSTGFEALGPSGTIKPGETLSKSFTSVAGSQGMITITGKAKYSFTMPDGTTFTQQTTQKNPDVKYEEDAQLGLAIFQINKPAAGTWKVSIDGKGMTQAEDYQLGMFVQGSPYVMHLEAMSKDSDPAYSFLSAPGDIVYVRTYVTNNGKPVTGVTWQVAVKDPNLKVHSLTMYDDGKHADGAANDGVSVSALTAAGPDGHNELYAQALLPGNVISGVGDDYEVQVPNDVMVDSVTVSPSVGKVGQPMTITVVVKEAGMVDVNNGSLELYSNNTSTPLKTVTFSVKAGQSTSVQIPWTPTLSEDNKLRVTVDPFKSGEPYASNFDNNTKTVVVPVSK